MPLSLRGGSPAVNDHSLHARSTRAQILRWFDTALGRSLQAVEAHHLRAVLPQLYGTVGLQLGRLGRHELLDACVAPKRFVLDEFPLPATSQRHRHVEQMLTGARTSAVRARPERLPLDTRSVDIAVLPHTLDFAEEPHQVLREVSRVLTPEGHAVVIGFNAVSLWSLRRALTRRPRPAPWSAHFLRLARIRDWLALLEFDVTHGSMLYYRPPVQRQPLMDRLFFLEKAGDRWWPMMAAVYMVVARKRVFGMTPLPVEWKKRPVVGPGAAEPAVREALQRRIGRSVRRE